MNNKCVNNEVVKQTLENEIHANGNQKEIDTGNNVTKSQL